MDILEQDKANQILTEWRSRRGDALNPDQIKSATQMFYEVMKEKVNSSKVGLEQESLLTAIAHKMNTGEAYRDIKRQHSDNKHMNYFDVVFEKGQSNIIEYALEKHKIPTEILRNVRKNIGLDETYGGVRVVQEVEQSESGGMYVVSFEIYKDGELIYSTYKSLPEKLNEYQYADYSYDVSVTQYRKDGKERKSAVVAKYNTTSGIFTKELMQSSANPEKLVTTYRDSRGRFAKKV